MIIWIYVVQYIRTLCIEADLHSSRFRRSVGDTVAFLEEQDRKPPPTWENNFNLIF